MIHSKQQQQQHRNILFKQSLIKDSLHVWSIIGLPLRRTQAKYVILNAYFKTSIIRGGYTGVYVPGGAHCGNPGGPGDRLEYGTNRDRPGPPGNVTLTPKQIRCTGVSVRLEFFENRIDAFALSVR